MPARIRISRPEVARRREVGRASVRRILAVGWVRRRSDSRVALASNMPFTGRLTSSRGRRWPKRLRLQDCWIVRRLWGCCRGRRARGLPIQDQQYGAWADSGRRTGWPAFQNIKPHKTGYPRRVLLWSFLTGRRPIAHRDHARRPEKFRDFGVWQDDMDVFLNRGRPRCGRKVPVPSRPTFICAGRLLWYTNVQIGQMTRNSCGFLTSLLDDPRRKRAVNVLKRRGVCPTEALPGTIFGSMLFCENCRRYGEHAAARQSTSDTHALRRTAHGPGDQTITLR